MAFAMRSLLKKPALAGAAYAGLAIADTVLATKQTRSARLARYATKPLLMPTLAHGFFHSTRPTGVAAGSVLVGQAASCVGDVALLGRGNNSLLTGIGAFLTAHVSYTAAFATEGRHANPLRHPGIQAGAAAFALLGPVNAYAAGKADPRLRGPVLAYAGVISGMLGASTFLDPELSKRSRAAVLAGAGLFVVSDAILGAKQFVLKRDVPALDGAVMATYTAGQGLIALGMSEAIHQRRAATE